MNDYVEKMGEIVKRVQAPWQSFANLSAETWKGFDYIKPEDLSKIQPQELLEKQWQLAFKNGHLVLDHMQKTFDIAEKALKGIVADVKQKTELNK